MLAILLIAWLGLAIGVSASGVLGWLPGPGVQVVLIGLTELAIAAGALVPSLRRRVTIC